jgi:hypothetical protein
LHCRDRPTNRFARRNMKQFAMRQRHHEMDFDLNGHYYSIMVARKSSSCIIDTEFSFKSGVLQCSYCIVLPVTAASNYNE